MTKEEQIDTIKARINDCETNNEKFITVRMFMEDTQYDVENIKEVLKQCGIESVMDLLVTEPKG